MLRERIRIGVQAGLIGAASVIGGLIGFGWRRGTPARPFNDAAVVLLGDRARGIWDFDLIATMTGVVVYLAGAVALGILFALIAARWRGWRFAAAAVLLAGAAFVLQLPATSPREPVTVLTAAHAVALSVALALAVVVGTRLAQREGGHA